MTVRLLADESCDFSAVRALRAAGFDVLAVVEHCPGATDDEVIALSVQGGLGSRAFRIEALPGR